MAIYLKDYPELLKLQESIENHPEFVEFCKNHNIVFDEVKYSAAFANYIITLFNYQRVNGND